jgi:polysaccharide export outer membrane protein
MIATMQSKFPVFLVILTLLAASVSKAAETLVETAPVPISRATVPYVVGILDRITIKHTDDSVESLQVIQDGTISLGDKNYLVKGLTPAEVIKLVRQHGSNIASVNVEEYRQPKISVLGEVFHQIYTDMNDGPMRVLDAIASANGFTPLANTRRVRLMRENAGRVEIYELDLRRVVKGELSAENILLRPGDVITVPRNFL